MVLLRFSIELGGLLVSWVVKWVSFCWIVLVYVMCLFALESVHHWQVIQAAFLFSKAGSTLMTSHFRGVYCLSLFREI